MGKTIDLNCDMGESFGAWTMGRDEALLELVTSATAPLAEGEQEEGESELARVIDLTPATEPS